jgi:hypothetical protein
MSNKHEKKPAFQKEQGKGKQFIIQFLRKEIEAKTGLSITELKNKYTQEHLFYEALKYVTTTKKALCEALLLPVEGSCRYKRKKEKIGLLKEVKKVNCPLTGHEAWTLTTDEKLFPQHPKQGNLFE